MTGPPVVLDRRSCVKFVAHMCHELKDAANSLVKLLQAVSTRASHAERVGTLSMRCTLLHLQARAGTWHFPGVLPFATVAQLIVPGHHDAVLVLEPNIGTLVARMVSEDPIDSLRFTAVSSADDTELPPVSPVHKFSKEGRGRTVAVAFSTVPIHSSRTFGSTQLYVVMLRT